MKIKILSLAALLICGLFSDASALRLSSESRTQFNISQTSYSERTPFKISGKIWGPAPVGEVTRILYTLKDASNNTLWEFAEPYVRTFEPDQKIEADFKFDFSDVLISGDSVLLVELQNSSMSGAFTKTLAQGVLRLVFPSKFKQELLVSQIKKFLPVVTEKEVVNQITFQNNGDSEEFFAKVRLHNQTGEEIMSLDTPVVNIEEGESHDFELTFTRPEIIGVYDISAQVYSGRKALTGINRKEITFGGEFGVFSDLRISPAEFLYAGDTATIEFEGAISTAEVPVQVKIRVQDKKGNEVFASDEELTSDIVGKISGTASFVVPKETSELIVVGEFFRGNKSLGRSEYRTGIYKKLMASEGQSQLSFQAERVQQEFETGNLYKKMGMILMLALILGIAGSFIWIVIHRSKPVQHLVLLLGVCGLFSVANAANVIVSNEPAQNWLVSSDAEDEMLRKIRFSGIVEVGVSGVFPVNSDITAEVRFLNSSAGVEGTVTQNFQTDAANTYDFTIDSPTILGDGEYGLEIAFTWPGITLPGGVLEISLLYNEEPLIVIIDSSEPEVVLTYYRFDGEGQFQELQEGDFTKTPVYVSATCTDDRGCMSGVDSKFLVTGNFCTGADFCLEGIDEFLVCDQIGNCAAPAQAEIKYYDPVAPNASALTLQSRASGTIKALTSYLLEITDMADANEAALAVDSHACGGEDSPFYADNIESVCREKFKVCGVDASTRGIIDQENDPETCRQDCPEGTTYTPWGTCEECSFTNFPFCFDWQLGGPRCESFPFCFEAILQ